MELDRARALFKAEHLLNQQRYDEAYKEVNTYLARDLTAFLP